MNECGREYPPDVAPLRPPRPTAVLLRPVALRGRVPGRDARFAAITLGDEVPRGKPAPDIFLETARRLDQPPDRCVVFEDSLAGIAAARAAGMRCIALATTHSVADLRAAAPDLVVADYDELLRVMPELAVEEG